MTLESNPFPETHEWRNVTELQPGDFVHRWGDDLEVKQVTIDGDKVTISYLDTDGKVKEAEYKSSDALDSKKNK